MEHIKILIVEDDKDLSDIMRDYLKNEGYSVEQVFSGTDAIVRAKEINPTLIILDIMLPGVEGLEVCRQIRMHSHCPIIIVSAKQSESDKLLSFGIGADDYMTKPFSLLELVVRVKSQIRRFTTFTNAADGNMKVQEERVYGAMKIKPSSFTIEVNGKDMLFTATEFRLIDFMSLHPKQVFTKEQLMNCVWGNEYLDDNTVAVYVGRIREKLAKEKVNYIKTVWGIGYKWEV